MGQDVTCDVAAQIHIASPRCHQHASLCACRDGLSSSWSAVRDDVEVTQLTLGTLRRPRIGSGYGTSARTSPTRLAGIRRTTQVRHGRYPGRAALYPPYWLDAGGPTVGAGV